MAMLVLLSESCPQVPDRGSTLSSRINVCDGPRYEVNSEMFCCDAENLNDKLIWVNRGQGDDMFYSYIEGRPKGALWEDQGMKWIP